MSGINIKIGTVSNKFHYPYEGILSKSTGPKYITKEITGNGYINLTNAVANYLIEFKVYGGTEQNGTPTPTSPIDIISNNGAIKVSNNLLDMSEENIVMGKFIDNEGVIKDSPNNFYNGKYIPVISGEEYTRSTSKNIRYISIIEYDSNKTFIKRTLFNNGTSGGQSGSLILQNNTSFVLFGSNPFTTEITLNDIISIEWKFEKGSIATPYNPYGLIYTDGTIETIGVHGKNLFNKNGTLTNGYINSLGAIVGSSNSLKISPLIEIKPNTTYTLSGTGDVKALSYDRYAYTYTAEQTPIAQIPSQTGGASTTFTTAQNAKYIRIQTTPDAVNTCQLELGSTATEYVPYFNGGTATAEMLLKIGDYADEQEILSGNIIRKIGIKVFDGTETFIVGNNGWITEDAITDQINEDYYPYCTHFAGTNTTPAKDSTVRVYRTSNLTARVYFGLDKTIYTSISVFKQFLADQYSAGTPVIIAYVLATPTTESVAGQAINIPAGDSTIEITQASIENLPLYAKYKATA